MAKRFVILGAGRFGAQLAAHLSAAGCDVLLCDADEHLVQSFAEQGFRTARLTADEAGDLKAVGVREADAVVVAIGEDMQSSVLATMTLKEMGVGRVVARATTDKHAQILRRLGADLVVAPDQEAAARLAEQLQAGTNEQRLPIHGEYQVAQVRLGNALSGTPLGEAELEEKHKVTPVLVVRPSLRGGKEEELLPAPKVLLRGGDFLFVVGHKEDINEFEEQFGLRPD